MIWLEFCWNWLVGRHGLVEDRMNTTAFNSVRKRVGNMDLALALGMKGRYYADSTTEPVM